MTATRAVHKKKLRTSLDVYHRLLHDSTLPMDIKNVRIGYTDTRYPDLQWMAVEEWTLIDRGGEIPMHHIQKFKVLNFLRYNELIFWDRKTRMDRLFGSGETTLMMTLGYKMNKWLIKNNLPTIDASFDINSIPAANMQPKSNSTTQNTHSTHSTQNTQNAHSTENNMHSSTAMVPKSKWRIFPVSEAKVIANPRMENNVKYVFSFGCIGYKYRKNDDGDVPAFLLIQHKYNREWGFPKGRWEVGERRDGFDTAMREFHEETGIPFNDANVIDCDWENPCILRYEYMRKRVLQKKVTTLFAAQLSNIALAQIVRPNEIGDIRWLTIEQCRSFINRKQTATHSFLDQIYRRVANKSHTDDHINNNNVETNMSMDANTNTNANTNRTADSNASMDGRSSESEQWTFNTNNDDNDNNNRHDSGSDPYFVHSGNIKILSMDELNEWKIGKNSISRNARHDSASHPPQRRHSRNNKHKHKHTHQKQSVSSKQLSKTASWLLRHGATEAQLNMGCDGFVRVSEFLNTKQMVKRGATFDHILEMVREDNKERYSIAKELSSTAALTLNEDGMHSYLLRANQGHSDPRIKSGELLNEITLKHILQNQGQAQAQPQFNHVCHGTYVQHMQSILETGLSKRTRRHIHFAADDSLDSSNVKSGMRTNCEILIYIDIEKAIRNGVKFYRSANNVILTEGDHQGFLLPTFFTKIVEFKAGQSGKTIWTPPNIEQQQPQSNANTLT